MLCHCLFFVFFFKQKTAYEMRISDWSSDVCSSDLLTYDADSGNWLLAHGGETDALTDVEAIQFADVKVWLADGANQTVQQAIGAAAGGVGDTAGDIVLMRDGVHSGDVTIDKSITLLGYGDTSTVLTGPGDAGSGIAVVADRKGTRLNSR